ncbi:hypothetical protein BDZ97DRAFT_1753125 [Flammula alnicola]|nr:hypothetical protein BDZ97DRAFT_1753125 [Flammula alnicola]
MTNTSNEKTFLQASRISCAAVYKALLSIRISNSSATPVNRDEPWFRATNLARPRLLHISVHGFERNSWEILNAIAYQRTPNVEFRPLSLVIESAVKQLNKENERQILNTSFQIRFLSGQRPIIQGTCPDVQKIDTRGNALFGSAKKDFKPIGFIDRFTLGM